MQFQPIPEGSRMVCWSSPSSLQSLLFAIVTVAARRCRCRSSGSRSGQLVALFLLLSAAAATVGAAALNDRYADRPLPGGTAKIDRRRSISAICGRFKVKSTVGDRLRKKKERRRGGKEEEEEEEEEEEKYLVSPVLPERRRRPHRLQVIFLPTRGDGTSPHAGESSRRRASSSCRVHRWRAECASSVVEDTNALILLCDDNEDLRTWQKRLQGAIYRASGPATISSISEISSPAETTIGRSYDIAPTLDVVYMERLFVTGVLDELRVCFSCSVQSNQSLKKMLVSHENRLFEFRAIGGQVTLSYKVKNNSFKKSESEKFFEALDDLDDLVDNFSGQDSFLSPKLSLKPPSFCRIPGLTPDAELQTWSLNLNRNDMLDSFVKAQIVIYDQSSSHYNNLDNKVSFSS
ncbi:hypothetical protein GW17_00015458 [Ensete ventricosum]|nr:hypothetical protein GW17_00015458 [Ensete ventricosum]